MCVCGGCYSQEVRSSKKTGKATHPCIYAYVLSSADQSGSGDDGESGAGQILLRLLQSPPSANKLLVVTRW